MTKLLEMTDYLLSGSHKAKQFYIKVRIEGFRQDELIVNDYLALADKLIYIHTTYDGDLKHKHSPLEIVDYGYILKDSIISNELNSLIGG